MKYDTSKFISKNFYEILQNMRIKAIRENYDYVIVISGEEGTGKSSLGLHIAFTLDENFDFSRLYISKSDLIRFYQNITNAKKLNSHVFDEAQNFIPRVNNGRVRDFVQFIQSARLFTNFYIFVSPRFDLLHSDLLRRADMIIYVKSRGTAFVYFDTEKDKRKTDMVEFIEKMRRQSSFFSLNTMYTEVFSKIPPVLKIKFKKLPAQIEEVYLEKKREYMSNFVQYLIQKYSKNIVGDEDAEE